MAETVGENIALIILGIIFISVIIIIGAYFVFFGFGFTDATTCYASSLVRNFFFNDLCATQYLCISSSLASLHLEPPLLGCSPSASSFSSSDTNGQIFSSLSTGMVSCWDRYGANQGLLVLPNSPGMCSVSVLDTNRNITFRNLTNYLQDTAYTTQVSCLNHTAAQSCANYQEGFSCDVNAPSVCVDSTSDYFLCRDQPNYVPTSPGYYTTYIPLNSSVKSTNAANNMSAFLCEESQGCYFNKAIAECTNSTGSPISCTQTYTDFCQKESGSYNCTVGYDPTTNGFEVPNSCTLTEPVNPKSVENVSYFSYLKPGVNVIFSYKNITSGKSEFVSPYSNLSIGHSEVYYVYLNSFAGSRFPPKTISLPTECAPATFLNNYPTQTLQYECSRSLLVFGSAFVGGSINPGIVTTGEIYAGSLGSGYLYAKCTNNKVCNQYIASNLEQVVSTGALTTTGLSQCASGILSSIESIPYYLHLTNGNFLGRNQLFICVETT